MHHYIMDTIRKIWRFLSTQLTPWFAGAIFILIILLLLFIFPGWEGYDSSLIKILGLEGHEEGWKEDRETVIKYLGFAISGLALFLGIYVASRRTGAMEEGNRQTEEGNRQTEEGNRQTEEGNRQTVFRDALTHLGSKSVVTRVAGVYILHGLAQREESMRPVIVETLLAHIRVGTQESEYQEKNKSRPSYDIQLLLEFLFCGEERFLFETQSVDLRQAYLRGANLMNAQLQEADLNGAQLQGARLSGAQLQGAGLSGAQLQGARLSGAQLQGAHLWKAKLQGAYLNGAKLQRAFLKGTQLQGAYLWKAQLQGAYLNWAKLQGADLNEAKLQGAYLIRAQLQGAYLKGAQLQGGNLNEAQLQWARLNEAQLQGGNLNKAQLQGGNLSGAQLQGADLSGAQLQGAHLREAQFQGAFSEPFRSDFDPFEEQIHSRIGEESALSGAVFSGGLTQEEVDKIEGTDRLKKQLQLHVGKDASHELPENSGAITGKYTQKDANKWIAEYQKAVVKNNSADPDTIS